VFCFHLSRSAFRTDGWHTEFQEGFFSDHRLYIMNLKAKQARYCVVERSQQTLSEPLVASSNLASSNSLD
jgi:hypothetical protein